MKRLAIPLAIFLLAFTLLMAIPVEAALRVAIIQVKGMVCPA